MSANVLIGFLVLVTLSAAMGSLLTRVVLALFALGFFVLDYVNYDLQAFSKAIVPTLGVLVALFGFFVMFRGVSRRR